jgi:O-antigen/teichoic acid export membrane protein
MSFKKNLLKNGIATLILKGLKIAEQLLLVPFFITAWGAAYYGEWLTLTIIPTVLGLSDLGFGSAASNAFILRYASNDRQGAANMIKSGFRTIHIVVFSGIIFTLLLLFILSYFEVFDKTLVDKRDAIIAISFLMVARFLAFYQQLFDAYFKAARRASLSINLLGVYSGLNLFGGLIVLYFKGNIVSFAFVNFCTAILFVIFYALIAKRILSSIKEYQGKVYKTDIKLIITKGFGYLLSPIWQAIFFQGTTFVVRIVLGPVAVTIFNTVRTATRAINQANTIVINSVMPEMQYEIGANNLTKARKIFRFSFFSTILISGIGMILLYFFGLELYVIWTKNQLSPPVEMWNVFIIGILFNAIWWLSGDILLFSNKPFEFTSAAVIIALLSVLISYVLSMYFGLTGAALGSLFLDTVLVLYILPKSLKLLGQPIKSIINDTYNDFNVVWIKLMNSIKSNK